MPHPVLLGWREWLSLPVLGIVAVRAKVDTGARSSALHVLDQEVFMHEGREFVRFLLDTGVPGLPPQPAQADVEQRALGLDQAGLEQQGADLARRFHKVHAPAWRPRHRRANERARGCECPRFYRCTAASGRHP